MVCIYLSAEWQYEDLVLRVQLVFGKSEYTVLDLSEAFSSAILIHRCGCIEQDKVCYALLLAALVEYVGVFQRILQFCFS